MTDSRTEAGIITDEPEASEVPENKEVLKDSHNYKGMSKTHRNQVKEFPVAKVGTI